MAVTTHPALRPGANDVIAAMVATAESWSWAGHVTVTRDPSEVAASIEAPSLDHTEGQRRVLFVGSPSDLMPEGLSAVGVITTEDCADAELAVLCSRNGTVDIIPTQLRLRACTLAPNAARGVGRGT